MRPMVDMRETVGRACLTSDLSQHYEEDDLARIAALGRAAAEAPLGAAITRWVGAMEASSYVRVVSILTLLLRDRYAFDDETMACRIAQQACLEFNDWACRNCGGRGEAVSGEGLRFTCPTCNGTRLHRYSDQSRMASMLISAGQYRDNYSAALAWAIGELRAQDHRARGIEAYQLGRD